MDTGSDAPPIIGYASPRDFRQQRFWRVVFACALIYWVLCLLISSGAFYASFDIWKTGQDIQWPRLAPKDQFAIFAFRTPWVLAGMVVSSLAGIWAFWRQSIGEPAPRATWIYLASVVTGVTLYAIAAAILWNRSVNVAGTLNSSTWLVFGRDRILSHCVRPLLVAVPALAYPVHRIWRASCAFGAASSGT